MTDDYGIYVHTPWCQTRCPYCAFNVVVSTNGDYRGWADAVLAGWQANSMHFSGRAHSLYFGGGTPSLAPPETIGDLVQALPLADNAEITVEVNPGSIDKAGLEQFVRSGVNRLSLGVQTFERTHAQRLGRGHTIEQAHALLSQVNTLSIQSWSFDLMFALPDQSLEELDRDLDILLEYRPPHVSLYGLTIEHGTPFERAQSQGKLVTPDTTTWRVMYDRIVQRLTRAGFERYEVSNFAIPGHRAIHNERVWRGGHYAGLGPGAHGYLPSGARTISMRDIQAWMLSPTPLAETPSKAEAAVDFILSTLRHVDGTSHQQLQQLTGFKVPIRITEALESHGLITTVQDHIQLTQEGFPIADGIVRELIDHLEPTKPT